MEPTFLDNFIEPSRLWLALLVAGAVVLPPCLFRLLGRERRLAPHELQERIDAGLDLLVVDLRPEGDFANCHIAQALSVPMSRLRTTLCGRASVGDDARERTVVLVCEDETTSRRAAERLHRAGFTRVHVLDGGMRAWRNDGLPVETALALAEAAGG